MYLICIFYIHTYNTNYVYVPSHVTVTNYIQFVKDTRNRKKSLFLHLEYFMLQNFLRRSCSCSFPLHSSIDDHNINGKCSKTRKKSENARLQKLRK